MFETIVALATAPIKSALSIIRLSGDDVFDGVSKCFSKDLRNIQEKTVLFGSVISEGKKIDEVVLKADLIGAVARATIVSNIGIFLKNTHRVSFIQRK